MEILNDTPGKKRKHELHDYGGLSKKVCPKDFSEEKLNPENWKDMFQDLIKRLENENVTLDLFRKITEVVQQMKVHNLNEELVNKYIANMIEIIIKFLKSNFINHCHKSEEVAPENNHDFEIIFQGCLVNFSILSDENIVKSMDVNEYIDDTIFFFNKEIDKLHEIRIQLQKTRKLKDRQISHIYNLLVQNFDYISRLVKIRYFKSLNTVDLTKACIRTILQYREVEVQLSALKIIKTFYNKGEELRAFILNIMLKSLTEVNESYKFEKNYNISGDLSISVFTVFIVALMENAPFLGFYETNEMRKIEINQNFLQDSFENVTKIVRCIITNFINRISNNLESFKSYYIVFNNIITELVQLSNEPEWPLARFFLNHVAKALTEILKNDTETNLTKKMIALRNMTEIILKMICDKKDFISVLDDLKKKFSTTDDNSTFSEYAQKTLIHYLNCSPPEKGFCKILWGMQWFENIKHETDSALKIERLIKLLNETEWKENKFNELLKEEKKAIIYYLETVRYNYADYAILIKYIVYCCCDRSKKIKLYATSCLFNIMQLDVDLLSQPVISKAVTETVLFSNPLMKREMCLILDKYLTYHPDEIEDFTHVLFKFLKDASAMVKKNSIDVILNAIIRKPDMKSKARLCYKVLELIENEDPLIQKHVTHFCTVLWFGEHIPENLDALLDVIDMINASRFLRPIVEEKLKPSVISLINDNSSQSEGQVEVYRNLIALVYKELEKNEKILQCLRIISLFVTILPDAFTSDLLLIATPLRRLQYSEDYAIEILTAEILNCLLRKIINPDMMTFIVLKSDLVNKLASNESLQYTVGLIVSLLRLIKNLSKFDKVYIWEKLFLPNVEILKGFMLTQNSNNIKTVIRALCIAVYLHVDFPDECEKINFNYIFQNFIESLTFGVTTLQCLCHLSMEHKSVMKNEIVQKTIEKHLKEGKTALFIRAALYNILCSLKNVDQSQSAENFENMDNENVAIQRDIVEKYLKYILHYTVDERVQIRHTSYLVLKQVLDAGIISESRLIPFILLMSADPVPSLAAMGTETLKKIREKNIFDCCRYVGKSIIVSMRLYLKCKERKNVRGYRSKSKRDQAICNHLYLLYQEDVVTRRIVIDSVMKELIPEASTTLNEKLYLADHLASFSYKYIEEIIHIVNEVDLMLSDLKISANIPTDKNEKTSYVEKYSGLLMLKCVREYLTKSYGLTDEKLYKHYWDENGKHLIVNRLFISFEVPKIVLQPNSEDKINELAEIIHDKLKKSQTL